MDKLRLINPYDAYEYARLRNDKDKYKWFFSQQKFSSKQIEEWLQKVSSPTDSTYVLQDQKKLIGAVSIYNISNNQAEVGRILVDPLRRRRGFSTYLLNSMREIVEFRKLNKLHAYITNDNTASKKLFQKCGYIAIKVDKEKTKFILEL